MIVNDLPIQRRSSQTPPPDNRGGRIRLILLGIGMMAALVLLLARMFDYQINRSNDYQKRAQSVSERTRDIPALRGLIYDREGTPLVLNAPSYQVGIIPAQLPAPDNLIQLRLERAAIYNRLADMLNQADRFRPTDSNLQIASAKTLTTTPNVASPILTAGEIFTKVFNAQTLSPYDPVIVAENVPRDLALIIQEQSIAMPGVIVRAVGSRTYPYKELLGPLLGYIGKIPEENAKDYPDTIYAKDDRVGLTGVEAVGEEYVRGTKGNERLLRDASGEIIGTIGEPTPAADGNGLRLTLDLRLQKIISDTLIPIMKERNSPRGAVVALNPNNGEVLGMVSVPSFDNNLFVRGPTQNELDALYQDINLPLLNHATLDRVPPGSTFKIVTAAALLEEGAISPNTVVNDPGIFSIPNQYFPDDETKAQKFYCWLRTGHGLQSISDALRNSCDTFFYKTVGGYKKEGIAGMDPTDSVKIRKWANLFGIGERTGFDLGSATSFVPSDEWKRRTLGDPWTTGDSYNISIGQGFLEVTPLDMANVIATIANGGTLYQPRILRDVVDAKGNVIQTFQPKVVRQLPIKAQNMRLIQNALTAVVSQQGTASTSMIPGFQYAGKTGTAEFCDDVGLKIGVCYPGIKVLPTHAWFLAYAPADKPQIALAVYVWNGGQGSGVAAPIAQRILAKYFNIPLADKDLAPVQKDKPTGSE